MAAVLEVRVDEFRREAREVVLKFMAMVGRLEPSPPSTVTEDLNAVTSSLGTAAPTKCSTPCPSHDVVGPTMAPTPAAGLSLPSATPLVAETVIATPPWQEKMQRLGARQMFNRMPAPPTPPNSTTATPAMCSTPRPNHDSDELTAAFTLTASAASGVADPSCVEAIRCVAKRVTINTWSLGVKECGRSIRKATTLGRVHRSRPQEFLDMHRLRVPAVDKVLECGRMLVLDGMQPWRRSGFSPGNYEQQHREHVSDWLWPLLHCHCLFLPAHNCKLQGMEYYLARCLYQNQVIPGSSFTCPELYLDIGNKIGKRLVLSNEKPLAHAEWKYMHGWEPAGNLVVFPLLDGICQIESTCYIFVIALRCLYTTIGAELYEQWDPGIQHLGFHKIFLKRFATKVIHAVTKLSQYFKRAGSMTTVLQFELYKITSFAARQWDPGILKLISMEVALGNGELSVLMQCIRRSLKLLVFNWSIAPLCSLKRYLAQMLKRFYGAAFVTTGHAIGRIECTWFWSLKIAMPSCCYPKKNYLTGFNLQLHVFMKELCFLVFWTDLHQLALAELLQNLLWLSRKAQVILAAAVNKLLNSVQ